MSQRPAFHQHKCTHQLCGADAVNVSQVGRGPNEVPKLGIATRIGGCLDYEDHVRVFLGLAKLNDGLLQFKLDLCHSDAADAMACVPNNPNARRKRYPISSWPVNRG